MSFLDRIAECNRHDPALYVPLLVKGRQLGQVRKALLPVLAPFAGASEVRIGDQQALDAAAEAIIATGKTPPARGERYRIGPRFGETWLTVERAAAEVLGITAYGVHLTGYVRRPDGLHVWVPRRTADRPTYPGELDSTVAGGQPAELGVLDNLVKECAEEAGMPEALARRATPCGVLRYRVDGDIGVRDDVIFCYELDCGDFTPVNQDGEVEAFALWPVARAMEVVARTRDFKFNCALVLIDFFVRHGLIAADDPDYVEICAGLKGGATDA
ncbi:MAG: DUF4743 domain-containing protein [Alphaproteobacteria bacterium]|jgi:hypothetical protein|nr:DUF4743 domain-containing protein [Alphaproteobacteria bacterium]